MSRSLRHGALAATAIAFSIASLAACGAGNDAATLQIKPDNAATTIGDISVQNVSVVTQPEATTEGPAVVTATVFNNGTKPQTLETVTLPGSSTPVKLTPAEGAGPIVIQAGDKVVLGGADNASAVIESGLEAAKDGDVQRVVFKFSSTGEVPLDAFVVPAKSFFEGYGPSALPTPPETQPTGTTSPSGKPTGSEAENGEDAGTTPADDSSASAEDH
ncbi:DUF461 domain-containing protein [Streptomyces sp. ML-6]|uniref:DUF461 domain-containing protein n=1 Tax=Streptomyces sp. ML-6 TaxID=2982693 RepID=UPI0024BF69E4|nr:DUF461 domain-containing protein [Streptomyces sp. ML-6]MDK0521127.1 DUF461 domain-containing protein [Streptomyces sp. ML-6]